MRRAPSRRRWWLWGGAAAVLVIAAAAATPFLVPVDRYRTLLEQYLTSSTGRPVEIASLRLALGPRVHVHATDVRLLNPTGFPRGNAIEARSIDLGIEPRALLARRLQIRTIAINDVQVNVLSDATGRTNYDLPAPPHPAGPPTAGARSEGRPLIALAPIGAVSINNVTIAVGTVAVRRDRTAPVLTVTGFNASVGGIDPNASNWTTRLTITADLEHARIVTPSLTAPILVQSGKILLRGGRGSATFVITLGATRASGTATIAGVSRPAITFAVRIPDLDVNAVRRVISHHAGPSSPGPSGPRRLIARGTLSADRVVLPPINATQLHASLSIHTDVVRADAYEVSAYGGTVRGTAQLDYAAERLPTVATAAVRGVDLAALLRALTPQSPRVGGALAASLSLSTAFAGDPLAALAGTGTFVVLNGSLPGVNVPDRIAQLAKTLQLNVPTGGTPFRSFGGDVRIARERVYSTALRLDATSVRGTARGSIGFDGSLDYAGTGVLSLASSGAGAALSPAALLSRVVPGAAGATGGSVSFSITGNISNPRVALAGTPQLVGGQPSGHQPAPSLPTIPGLPPALQNLLTPNR